MKMYEPAASLKGIVCQKEQLGKEKLAMFRLTIRL
jgi:hypothetical protein